jgi:fructose-1,6-bisphosphatase I
MGQTLTAWLLAQQRYGVVDEELVLLLASIASACRRISSLVARAPVDGMVGLAAAAGPNASGDAQKKLDVVANDVFAAAVRDCGRSGIIVSEEEEAPIAVQESVAGGYIACFDPIDGSSNIDAAVPTGSIFGIYTPGECEVGAEDAPQEVLRKCALNVRKAGTELVAAGYCMYSSSTVLVLTLGAGVAGFTLDAAMGEFVLSHPVIRIPDPGQRIFSGNAGNAALWAPPLRAYLDTLYAPPEGGKPYSYRYIGALVGDFHRTLLYGGIWLVRPRGRRARAPCAQWALLTRLGCAAGLLSAQYPPDAKAPAGKARLLYEVAPMALLAEQAGGLATWGATAEDRVLDVVPQSVHQRSPMFVGGASEVRRLQAFLKAAGAA